MQLLEFLLGLAVFVGVPIWALKSFGVGDKRVYQFVGALGTITALLAVAVVQRLS